MYSRKDYPTPLGIVQPGGDIKFKAPTTHAEIMGMLHLCLVHMAIIHGHMKQIHERAAAAGFKPEDKEE
jgi:acetylglutamate kinase